MHHAESLSTNITLIGNPMEYVQFGSYEGVHSSHSYQNVPYNNDINDLLSMETITKDMMSDLHSINATPYSYHLQFQFENNEGSYSFAELNFEQQIQIVMYSDDDFATLYGVLIEDLVLDMGQDTDYDLVAFNPVCDDYAVLIAIDVTNETYYYGFFQNQLSVTPQTEIDLIDATFTTIGYTYSPPQ